MEGVTSLCQNEQLFSGGGGGSASFTCLTVTPIMGGMTLMR